MLGNVKPLVIAGDKIAYMVLSRAPSRLSCHLSHRPLASQLGLTSRPVAASGSHRAWQRFDVRGPERRHHEYVSSIPLWVPLVVAGIGVAGTLMAGIAGGLITQRRSDRREASAWAREREREHERWAREDEARTFEHRRQAYADFYEAVKGLARTAYGHGYGFTEPELPEGWQSEAFAKLTRLEFYADRPVATAASLSSRVKMAGRGS